MVAEISPGMHPCSAIHAVFAHFAPGISRVKAMGKMPFLQFVLRARFAPQRAGFATLHSPGMSSTSCENFSPRSGSGGLQAALIVTTARGGQADRRTPRNSVN